MYRWKTAKASQIYIGRISEIKVEFKFKIVSADMSVGTSSY